MDQLVVEGKYPLRGEIIINGAKNSSLAILSAALMIDGICTIDNIPNIEDIRNLVDLMTKIGVKCTFNRKGVISIDSRNIKNCTASYESAKKIRASYYLIGAMLGRFKKAEVPLPGGCNFGDRPIDQHIKGFKALGTKVFIEHGMVKAYVDKLYGTNIYLDVVSVGATINIMLAATLAEGTTLIENAAKEPHVVDVANFLNMMGAQIKGAGTDIIRIVGVKKLHGGEYSIIPDQIEAGTYMIASAITAGDIKVKNIIPKHMDSLTAKLLEMRCKVEEGDDYIRVISDVELIATNIKTMVYPGFPTDLHPQMAALLSCAKGTSLITENVWESRFQYVNELKRLGCKINVEGKVAIIEGKSNLTGAEVKATDLRAGAALILLSLAAKGKTIINNIEYIDRGYENIESKLSHLGAKIKRIKIL